MLLPRRATFILSFRRALRKGLGVAGLSLGAVLALSADAGPLTSEALPTRSSVAGAPLFTRLEAARTGLAVVNAYQDPAMWGAGYQELVYGAIGTGLAAGDYDGDGRLDLYVVTKATGGRLYRNLGDWRFEDVTEKAGLGPVPAPGVFEPWRQGATFADVNNDGRPDLYVCRLGAPNLLYINQGNGTFKEEAGPRGLALSDASGVGAFCDYDRDGWLDVYVQTNMLDAAHHVDGQADHLYHNLGDGRFEDVSTKAGVLGESCGHSATWWDYDGDGWPDLYVTNDYGAADHLYRNRGDGSFEDVLGSAVQRTPYYSMGSDSADVNNDGRADLLAADMAASSHEKDLRGMAMSRARLAGTLQETGLARQVMHSALYLNTGEGLFQEAAYWAGVAATDWTWSVRFEDFDDDGWVDLHLTNGMLREFHNADLLQKSYGIEDPAGARLLVRNSPVMVERPFAFRNLRGLGFEKVTEAWGLGEIGVAFGSVTGDFDGDGDMDLIYSRCDGTVAVLRNDSDHAHRIQVYLEGTRSNRFGAGATVRVRSNLGAQMRTLTIARGYLSGSELVAHFGMGDDSIIDELRVEWPGGSIQVFHDLPADRRYRIREGTTEALPAPQGAPPLPLVTRSSEAIEGATATVLAPLDSKRVQVLLPFSPDETGGHAAVADLNGDGRLDAWLSATRGSPARLLLSAGDLWRVAEAPEGGGMVDEGPGAWLDYDADGNPDLLVTHTGLSAASGARAFQPELYRGNGHGSFEKRGLPVYNGSVGALVVADWNRDGRPDVFLGARCVPGAYPDLPLSALWLNGEGGFADSSGLLPDGGRLGMVKGALAADVDGDGWQDLFVSLEWGYVRCYRNLEGKGFEDWTERLGFAGAGSGLWGPLASGDFNGDGRLDFAVGNLGENTRYHADPTHPWTLLSHGSVATASRILIEGMYEGDRLYPLRTRNELAAKWPELLKRYPRNDVFARATVAEVIGEQRAAQVRTLKITELRCGVFLSQPDGRYQFAPFPREAQLAPIMGFAVGDLDGDGILDLFASQNAAVGSPAFDGDVGLVLLGDGRGGFRRVAPAAAGLRLLGPSRDVQFLAHGNSGAWEILVAAVAGEPSVWRKTGAPKPLSTCASR